MTVTLYHNPRCSKSRATLALLEEKGIEPKIVEYLKTPPSPEELDRVLSLLKMEPLDLMRKKEDPFEALGLGAGTHSREALIKAMVEHPVLIERPIVVAGTKAAIGRPPESVLDIL